MVHDYSQYRPEKFEYNGRFISNWFSNMVVSPIKIDDITYRSVENYYQAQKSLDGYLRFSIATMTPARARRRGREIKRRDDWEIIKYGVMKFALYHKFTQPMWRDKLLSTGDEVIIEWNNWGDSIWGVPIDTNKGQNLLGKALMEVRSDLRLIGDDLEKLLTSLKG